MAAILPGHNIKGHEWSGATVNCHALAGKPHCAKNYLSDGSPTILPYGTTFASASALSPEKSSKNIQMYLPDIHAYIYTKIYSFTHVYIHDLSPFSIDFGVRFRALGA